MGLLVCATVLWLPDNLVLSWLALRIRTNATKNIQNNMVANMNTGKFTLYKLYAVPVSHVLSTRE